LAVLNVAIDVVNSAKYILVLEKYIVNGEINV
jgi:hypothetical protein